MLDLLVIFRHAHRHQLEKTRRFFSNPCVPVPYLWSELERDPATVKIWAKVAEATVVGCSIEIAAHRNQAAQRISPIPQSEDPKKLSRIFGSFGALYEFEQRAAALYIAPFPFFLAVRGSAAVGCHAVEVSGRIEHDPGQGKVGGLNRETASEEPGAGLEGMKNLFRIRST